ncbi:hypothetical protein NYG95_08570 [Campylobacter felis]|uniref:Terminase small subunit n=1 Tax=Campylobacter felis TaxID=2974565 RepID=A0ABT7I5S7_9BACT|nr:hypothetical protein [Campylobacter felis]MDL0109101.1 hypothetical protein [Campylobacter felis]MDL0147652.1 hypothetical protein [Campylobacter felis]
MIDKKLKDEIRLYFETHDEDNKQIAKKFNIKYRTLMVWVNKEGWEKAKGLKGIMESEIKKDMLKKEFGTIIDMQSEKIQQKLRENLNESLYNVDEILQKNLLDSVTDEILIKAMSLNFLQKNMALGALIAKDELMRMVNLRKEHKGEPQIIAGAEKFVSILGTLQKSFYGNDDSGLNLQVVNINEDLSTLSKRELLKNLEALENKEKNE